MFIIIKEINECSGWGGGGGTDVTREMNDNFINKLLVSLFFIQEINECDSSPCLNGGVCSDGIAYFSCSCASGYEGTTCQQG